MKKDRLIKIMTAAAAVMLVLTGCGRNELPAEEEFEVSGDGVTNAGIGSGSSFGEFLNAYGSYPLEIVADDGTWTDFDASDALREEEPVTDDAVYAVACFYIDGEPESTDEMLESTGTDASGLADMLASAEYLADHTAVYRYMLFEFRDNAVETVSSDYLDYNSEVYTDQEE